VPAPQAGVAAAFECTVSARAVPPVTRDVHRKKECLNLTDKATMLLKTKDRQYEQSQTKPIWMGLLNAPSGFENLGWFAFRRRHWLTGTGHRAEKSTEKKSA
jgi:hypothetical protein